MSEWKCEIRKANNGFIAEFMSEYDDGTPKKEEEIFQNTLIEGDDSYSWEDIADVKDEEKVAFAKMVHWLADYFGFMYDKYGSENLKVTWDKKGHKID